MSRLRDYAQLVRLPNLPTALADICLGALATGALTRWASWPVFALLLLTSACLYSAGMAWNDFFDVEQDKRERPTRPIPSGRVKRRVAALVGVVLLGGGLLFATLAGAISAWLVVGSPFTPPLIALVLAVCILLYDGWLKRTWAGPLGMGACRFFNLLLAVSVAGERVATLGVFLGLIVGLYVVGVTWFARTEARVSSQPQLLGAALVMLFSLVMALLLPSCPVPDAHPEASSLLYVYLLVALGFAIGFPVAAAVREPTPERVQAAVRRSLMCLIVLDAVLASALAGTLGLIVLLLLAPSLYLNRRRWLYAT
jgi:4-hydroxybenzoate polyprenyltransferase